VFEGRSGGGVKKVLFVPSGYLLVLGAVLQVSGTEDSVGSLDDALSSRDLTRLGQVMSDAQPYDTPREAYLIARGSVGAVYDTKVCVH
jgi:hypothetical protein